MGKEERGHRLVRGRAKVRLRRGVGKEEVGHN